MTLPRSPPAPANVQPSLSVRQLLRPYEALNNICAITLQPLTEANIFPECLTHLELVAATPGQVGSGARSWALVVSLSCLELVAGTPERAGARQMCRVFPGYLRRDE